MVFENLQSTMSVFILIFAGISGLLGVYFVNKIFHKKSKEIDGIILFTFVFLAMGYTSLALGELSRYLIFSIFLQQPSVSMPDIYWVFGGLSLLIGFVTLFVHLHKNHGDKTKTILSLVIGAVVIIGIIIYFTMMEFFQNFTGIGAKFLGFYYPIISSLVLIFSLSAYLFREQVKDFSYGLLVFVAANFFTLIADCLYNYYNYYGFAEQGIYGLIGLAYDSFYVIGYGLYAIAFFLLIMKLREFHEA